MDAILRILGWACQIIGYVVLAVMAFAFVVFLLVATGAAHEAKSGWAYPLSCCSGNDCAEVPVSDVRAAAGGFLFTVRPSLHPTVSELRTYLVPYHATKRAPDGLYHICINARTQEVLCAFVPGFGT